MGELTWSQEAQDFRHGIYAHYTGKRYRTVRIARHSETLEELVVYEDPENTILVWARPLTMFCEKVEHQGVQMSRFTFINSET